MGFLDDVKDLWKAGKAVADITKNVIIIPAKITNALTYGDEERIIINFEKNIFFSLFNEISDLTEIMFSENMSADKETIKLRLSKMNSSINTLYRCMMDIFKKEENNSEIYKCIKELIDETVLRYHLAVNLIGKKDKEEKVNEIIKEFEEVKQKLLERINNI